MLCRLNHTVPDGMTTCPICMSLRYEAGIKEHQIPFLQKAKTGEYPMRVMKKPPKHVLYYNDDFRTFCGQNLTPPPNIKNPQRPQINHVYFDRVMWDEACLNCRIAITQAFEGLP